MSPYRRRRRDGNELDPPDEVHARDSAEAVGFADSTLVDRSSLDEALASLRAVNNQLVTALETRVVIEQAKGILAERYRLDLDEAFQLLRFAARSDRSDLRTLAGSDQPAENPPRRP